MNHFAYTAELAEQHRTALLKSAQHARERRLARGSRSRRFRLTFAGLVSPQAERLSAPCSRLREAL